MASFVVAFEQIAAADWLLAIHWAAAAAAFLADDSSLLNDFRWKAPPAAMFVASLKSTTACLSMSLLEDACGLEAHDFAASTNLDVASARTLATAISFRAILNLGSSQLRL